MNLARLRTAVAIALATSSVLAGAQAGSVEPRTSTERLNEPGPQGEALARGAGTWDVTFTNWDAPGAAPTVVTGLVAERRMIGPMLEEILRPAPDAGGARSSASTTSPSTDWRDDGNTCPWTAVFPSA